MLPCLYDAEEIKHLLQGHADEVVIRARVHAPDASGKLKEQTYTMTLAEVRQVLAEIECESSLVSEILSQAAATQADLNNGRLEPTESLRNKILTTTNKIKLHIRGSDPFRRESVGRELAEIIRSAIYYASSTHRHFGGGAMGTKIFIDADILTAFGQMSLITKDANLDALYVRGATLCITTTVRQEAAGTNYPKDRLVKELGTATISHPALTRPPLRRRRLIPGHLA